MCSKESWLVTLHTGRGGRWSDQLRLALLPLMFFIRWLQLPLPSRTPEGHLSGHPSGSVDSELPTLHTVSVHAMRNTSPCLWGPLQSLNRQDGVEGLVPGAVQTPQWKQRFPTQIGEAQKLSWVICAEPSTGCGEGKRGWESAMVLGHTER